MPEPGPLIAIGGHEDRIGERRILRLIAAHLAGKPLALVTAASRHPEGYVDQYSTAFADLGVTVVPIPVGREDASANLALAGGVFFTGGKQARLVSRMNDSGLVDDIRRIWSTGAVIAGTSAGASALADRMIVQAPAPGSSATGGVGLGTGLGFIGGVIIDQHFGERGRSARLRAAVALEPDHIGIGLDEDTAIEFIGGTFTVHGSGAVSVIDARDADVRPSWRHRPATVRDALFHAMAAGDTFATAAA